MIRQCNSSCFLAFAVFAGAVSTGGVQPVLAQNARKAPAVANDSSPVDVVVRPVTDWLERANREYQDTVVNQLSTPTGKGAPLQAAVPRAQAAKPVSPVPANEPTVIEQIKSLLGLEPGKPAQPAPITEAEAKARDEVLRRQREARDLEQQRNAEQQRVVAEAKKAAELTDAATKERQKAAEAARASEEERRNRRAAAGDAAVTPKPTLPATARDQANERGETKAAEDAKSKEDAKARDEAKSREEAKLKSEAKAKDEAQKQANAAKAAEKLAAEKRVADEAKQARAAARLAEERAKADTAAAKSAEEAKKIAEGPKPPVLSAPAAPGANPNPSTKAEPAKPRAIEKDASDLADSANKAASQVFEKSKDRSKARVAQASDTSSSKRKSKGNKCAQAGEDIDPPGVYVVKAGDTLWGISRRHYEKGVRFERIVRANTSKIDSPDRIFPCQKFFLPARHALNWALPTDEMEPS